MISLTISWLKNCANEQIQVIGTKYCGGILLSEPGLYTAALDMTLIYYLLLFWYIFIHLLTEYF